MRKYVSGNVGIVVWASESSLALPNLGVLFRQHSLEIATEQKDWQRPGIKTLRRKVSADERKERANPHQLCRVSHYV